MKQVWLFAVCLLVVACSERTMVEMAVAGQGGDAAGGPAAGSGAGGGGSSGGTPGGGGIASDPQNPFDSLPVDCKGFEVRGLKYSPGGDALPNKCAPFDNVENNPYAIRCIDADPSYKSGFSGDEFCVLPPDPAKGTQVHVGPADYAKVSPEFLMQPGEEKVEFYYVNAGTTEDHYYYRTNLRMRAGSHHMIIRVQSDDHADGFAMEQDLLGTLRADTATNRSFGGAQRPDEDRPAGLAVPPENADIGELLSAGQQFSFNLHHFNLSQTPTLREVWVNIWYKPKSEIKRQIQGISIVGNPRDLMIPAGEHRVLHYKCPVTAPVRLITLNGHRHASTARFGAWVVRKADGSNQDVYESFDYNDMPTYQYDTLSKNPVPSVEGRRDGATSGMLELNAGDELHFVCDVTNKLDQPLKFANEVETGEMCILFGTRTGGALCGLVMRVND